MAVGPGLIGATDFALIRAVAGAAMLGGARAAAPAPPCRFWSMRRMPGALGLAVYLVGFSLAYLAIDAGIGALILFGGVQLTMFAGALLAGEAMAARRWIGAGPRHGWACLACLAHGRCGAPHGLPRWRCWPPHLAGASIR
jgi:hypothetical protein